jgi:Spy/CpxP family protein refolding chaperone
MLNIRAAALGAALLIGFAGVAGAQGVGAQGRGPQAGPGMRHRGGFEGGLVKDLNLTTTQQAQIKTIHEKYRAQFEALRSQFKGKAGASGAQRLNRDSVRVLRQRGDTAALRRLRPNISPELRQRMQTLRQQEQSEIRNVLTADQRTKFDAAQAQRKQQMENRGKNGRGGYGRAKAAQRG